ncbi:DUF6414 family protein [Rhodococcus sp. 05-2255-1e]|uniref:DUF6414 family protein n=1 Tax=Rhodococcus sp. 05-2255-1e TaxID=2022495 RepID=UPI00117BD3A3|nr:hypothetical protein [Rhodococcus sp. 05-2255-1e]
MSGLIQEMLQTGLLESAETDAQSQSNSSESANLSTDGKASAEVSVPGFGGAGLGGGRSKVRETMKADESSNVERLRYVFSQAYYLDQVRKRLKADGRIKQVHALTEAQGLRPGDIVEYSSSFVPNEINTVLDIATPELVSTIVKFWKLRENRQLMSSIDNVDQLRVHRQAGEYLAADYAELGAAISSALRKDFRSEHTREYHGVIVEGYAGESVVDGAPEAALTALTICETAHFVTADPDRLLDGEFTVLGKVVTLLAKDVPVLDRNKLLNRIDPQLLEKTLAKMQPDEAAQRLAGDDYSGAGVDLTFSALIEGNSFTVLPIAIYV